MNFRKSTPSLAIGLLTALLAVPSPAFAEWGVLISGITGCDFTTGWLTPACIPNFIGHLIVFVFGFVGIFFVLNVMYAGYELAIAYIGESDKGAGKERLKWSIVGLVLATCTFLILDLVLTIVLGAPGA